MMNRLQSFGCSSASVRRIRKGCRSRSGYYTSTPVFATMFLCCCFFSTIVHAQRNDVPARINLKDSSSSIEMVLTGRRGDTLYARLPDNATGSITYKADEIQRLDITLSSDVIRQAEGLAAEGKIDEAVKVMRSAIQPVVPYLDMPTTGIFDPALRYAALLRAEKSWAAAISVYRAMYGNADPGIQQQAAGWLAYCHVRNQQPKEAQEYLNVFTEEDPRHPGFVPGKLARSILASASGDPAEALDVAARVAALSRIDHELYPEAVFQSAGAYLRMSEIVPDQAPPGNVVLKKSGDEEPVLPAMLSGELLTVSSNLYGRIVQFFPASPYAAEATRQLDVISKRSGEKSSDTSVQSGAQQ
jgi:tetratricopeptide (TPR) repeat protein